MIRIATAGSVDDGKSTLIGRLMLETNSLFVDQIAQLEELTARRGEEGINLALVTDGLRAEREQNITIDVAYRPLNTETQRFLLADSPGHAQYTRNMVTAASTADMVLILCDALRGLTPQSFRHLAVATLLRYPRCVVLINKMDAVGFDATIYESMTAKLKEFAAKLGGGELTCIPISALNGDNVTTRSAATPWYNGPSVLELLNSFEPEKRKVDGAIVSIQNVLLGAKNQRFFSASLANGEISVGSAVQVLGGRSSRITSLYAQGLESQKAAGVASISFSLADEVDVSRGSWIGFDGATVGVAERCTATLFWMHDAPLRAGMPYRVQQGSRVILGTVTKISSVVDLETGDEAATKTLAMNDIGRVEIAFGKETPLLTYGESRELGSFVLVDPGNTTVAAGVIENRLTGSTKQEKAGSKVYWLTGLSGSGKSTLSEAVIERLKSLHIPVMHLDGDTLRNGLCSDLGFTELDRIENIRRTAEVAKLFAREGMVTLCSLISPLTSQRKMAREIVGEGFVEVYVQCDVDECIRRDPKGLYSRALSGAISNFTGVSAPYEPPETPEVVIRTQGREIEQCIEELLATILRTN